MKPIKLLIISDSHGRVQDFRTALARQSDVDAVIFLGDGIDDAEYLAASDSRPRMWMAVKGNCDFSFSFLGNQIKKTDSIYLAGKKIVFTHGDLYGAKLGIDGLMALARDEHADIVLYGHTHARREDYIDGVWYLNPGTVGGVGADPSCAVLTIDENNVLFSFMEFGAERR